MVRKVFPFFRKVVASKREHIVARSVCTIYGGIPIHNHDPSYLQWSCAYYTQLLLLCTMQLLYRNNNILIGAVGTVRTGVFFAIVSRRHLFPSLLFLFYTFIFVLFCFSPSSIRWPSAPLHSVAAAAVVVHALLHEDYSGGSARCFVFIRHRVVRVG